MAVLTVSLVEGGKVAHVGGRGLSMPCLAKNVERRWRRTLVKVGEMPIQEDENIKRNWWQKTRTTLSFGCTPSTTTKVVRISTTQWRW